MQATNKCIHVPSKYSKYFHILHCNDGISYPTISNSITCHCTSVPTLKLTFSPLLSQSCICRPFDGGCLECETFHKCCQVPTIILLVIVYMYLHNDYLITKCNMKITITCFNNSSKHHTSSSLYYFTLSAAN